MESGSLSGALAGAFGGAATMREAAFASARPEPGEGGLALGAKAPNRLENRPQPIENYGFTPGSHQPAEDLGGGLLGASLYAVALGG